MAPMETQRKVPFQRTQRRIASSGIEPRSSNLSTTKLTLYHWAIAAASWKMKSLLQDNIKPHLHGRLLAARIDILPFFFLKSRRSLTRRKIHVRFRLCDIARHAPQKIKSQQSLTRERFYRDARHTVATRRSHLHVETACQWFSQNRVGGGVAIVLVYLHGAR